MSYFHEFMFGIYPYICLAVFFFGSLVRFDREQYTWKSDSSQLLRRGQLRWGSNLFHIGILGIFLGHLFGLLTPLSVWHVLGIEAEAKAIERAEIQVDGGYQNDFIFAERPRNGSAEVTPALWDGLAERRQQAPQQPSDGSEPGPHRGVVVMSLSN